VLAPSPDAAAVPTASTQRDERASRVLAGVLVALVTTAVAGFRWLPRRAPTATGAIARFDPARPRRGPPAVVAA
jgi:hypothetical protein